MSNPATKRDCATCPMQPVLEGCCQGYGAVREQTEDTPDRFMVSELPILFSSSRETCMAAQLASRYKGTDVEIDYTNHLGKRAVRRIVPFDFVYGHSKWHPKAQWLLQAYDLDKSATRTFAVATIHRWGDPKLTRVGDADFHKQETLKLSIADLIEAQGATSTSYPNSLGPSNWAAAFMAHLKAASQRNKP
jgi:hypothetical protein